MCSVLVQDKYRHCVYHGNVNLGVDVVLCALEAVGGNAVEERDALN